MASQKAFEDPAAGDAHLQAGDEPHALESADDSVEDDIEARPMLADANGLMAGREAPELFYKSGGKSAENLNKDRDKFRSEERNGSRLPATREGR